MRSALEAQNRIIATYTQCSISGKGVGEGEK